MAEGSVGAARAVEDFYRARRRATLSRFLAQMGGGRGGALIPYEEVRVRLRAVESAERRLEDVPLDAIVGSVGRYQDFTREFLPRASASRERWVGVKMAMTGLEGVPPIELYRVGDAYFVRDGHHRVSVARELGARYVQAYVTPVRTRVPYAGEDDPETLILKSEYVAFLERTRLDELRPGADLSLTEPGSYDKLLEHISVHRYYMGIDEDREVGWEEAVVHWYDTVYAPVLASIRASGVLRGFPGRTEADLYLWLAEHRARLEEELGWELPSQQVVSGVAGEPLAGEEERGALLRSLAESPEARERGYLADDLLVAFDLGEPGLTALDQGLILAGREQARVYGLRVLDPGSDDAERAQTRATFEARCAEAGVDGQLAFEEGDPVGRIVDRARWADLVICNVAYPERPGEPATLAQNVRPLLRRSPRPLLALPGATSALERPLLAYDGGVRARTALFATVYMALRWGVHPVVLTVGEGPVATSEPLQEARAMFERYGVRAEYVAADGSVADGILRVADERDRDVIVMGSHTWRRWLEGVLGGLLEQVLMRAERPVLIT
jgi:nucleotide-binding universal stress UspA family protein